MKPELILDIIIIIIGLYLALFKSYFQEKGKNIATSEDIEALTEKVEAVKEKFLERNATIKAKLDLLTNLQIGHKTDEKEALLSFHKIFSQWINMLTEAAPVLMDDYDDKEISQKMFLYNETYENVLMAESVLAIYSDDQKLFDSFSEVKKIALEHLTTNPMHTLIHLKQNNFKYRQLDQIQDYDQKAKAQKEILDERTAIYLKYRDTMLDGLRKIVESKNNYDKYVREYLKSLVIQE